VSRKNRLSSSHSNRMLTNTIMSVPSTGTSHVATVNGHQNTAILRTWTSYFKFQVSFRVERGFRLDSCWMVDQVKDLVFKKTPVKQR